VSAAVQAGILQSTSRLWRFGKIEEQTDIWDGADVLAKALNIAESRHKEFWSGLDV
jgi:hypothetical protein